MRLTRLPAILGLILIAVLASIASIATMGLPPVAHAQADDGSLVILLNGDLYLFDETTGVLQQLTQWGYNQTPARSPDGRRVAYASVAEIAIDALRRFGDTPNIPPTNIWLIDLQTRQAARIASQPPGASFGTANPNEVFIRRSMPAWSPDGALLAWVEFLAGGNNNHELVIFDVAHSTVQARVPVALGSEMAALGPRWGNAGIALRFPAFSPGVGIVELFRIFNSEGVMTASFEHSADAHGGLYDFDWLSQGGQEYLALLYADTTWRLLEPRAGSTVQTAGQPERVSAAAAGSVSVYPIAGQTQGAGFAWAVNLAGTAYSLDFYGMPDQIAISPSGQAFAFASDAVYIVRGGQLRTVLGTQGTNRIALAWGWNTWRAGPRAAPTLPPTPTRAPVVVAPQVSLCAGAPFPRLAVGMVGRVTSTPALPNSLNSMPGRPSTNPANYRLANIPVGGTFTVLNGPVCAEGYWWWQVNYNSQVGWTAEGQGTTYWLEPMR